MKALKASLKHVDIGHALAEKFLCSQAVGRTSTSDQCSLTSDAMDFNLRAGYRHIAGCWRILAAREVWVQDP